MRTFPAFRRGSPITVALAFTFSVLPCTESFAAPDWSPIQTALGANGVVMPGNVLRFELARQDLALTVNGQALPRNLGGGICQRLARFQADRRLSLLR